MRYLLLICLKEEKSGAGKFANNNEESGVKLSGAKYGIYTDSACTNKVDTITTGSDGTATSKALVAGTYYVKEIQAPKGYVISGKVHTLTVKAGQTTSFAVLMPFNVQELNDSGGNYYGINQISKNINVGNRKRLINGNGFVFGVPGSGKSFFCKMEMGSVFLSGDDEIIVIDPMNE